MTTTEGEPVAAPNASATQRQIRGSSLLLSGRFISLGINFLVQVLIARHLSQAEFGAFAYALSLVTLGEMLVTVGLDRGVSRFLAIYDEEHDYDRMFGTLVMVTGTVVSLGLVLILLVVGLQGLIGDTMVSDPVAVGILVILIVLSPIQALDNLFGNLLAVFASARSIFLRKYVIAPLLRLAVVVLLILGNYGVGFLAAGYVLTGALGLLIYGGILWRVLGDRGIRSQFHRGTMRIPARAIFAFTLPLLTTDLVYIAMNTTDAIFLGHFWGTEEVAAFRVIQPLAGLNTVVFASFTMLYMPMASRLFARGDRDGVGGPVLADGDLDGGILVPGVRRDDRPGRAHHGAAVPGTVRGIVDVPCPAVVRLLLQRRARVQRPHHPGLRLHPVHRRDQPHRCDRQRHPQPDADPHVRRARGGHRDGIDADPP